MPLSFQTDMRKWSRPPDDIEILRGEYFRVFELDSENKSLSHHGLPKLPLNVSPCDGVQSFKNSIYTEAINVMPIFND